MGGGGRVECQVVEQSCGIVIATGVCYLICTTPTYKKMLRISEGGATCFKGGGIKWLDRVLTS